jgi:hypothetical protein
MGVMTVATAFADDSSYQQLDSSIERALNDVVDLGADMAIVEESNELSQSNQMLVLVSLEQSDFFKLDAIQFDIDGRTASYHQYTDAELVALAQGGSQRLFWDDIPPGRHKLSVSLFGHVPNDPDFHRQATRMIQTGNGRRVVELKVSGGNNHIFPDLSIKEWN